MKRSFVFAALFFLLSPFPALADTTVPSYVELEEGPSINADWSKGNVQAVTLHDARALTFANAQKGGRYTLIVKQDAHGSRTLTWPSSLLWPGGTAPMLTTTAGKTDFFTIFYDGVDYYALGITQNY